MSPRQQRLRLPTPSGGSLPLIVDLPERTGRRPAILLCHGFKGFLDWGFFPYLAELLAARGFVVVRANLTSAGMEPGDPLVRDLEAFRRATFSQDLREVSSLLAALGGRVATGRIDPDRVGIFGHSRGGGTAILTAAAARWRDRLRALVTWSAVATFDRVSAEEKQEWRQRGQLVIVNARTSQELPIGVELLDDLEAHGEELDIERAAARRTAPWLIVHGSADETVPVAEAERLYRAAKPPVELEVIPDAGHTLDAQQPFRGPTPALVRALNATQAWFRRHLA